MIQLLRRRIKWRLNQCQAEFAEGISCHFSWVNNCYYYDDALKEHVPMKNPEWQLWVDGCPEDKFTSEEKLKTFIIRYVYDIPQHELIPSEFLYDAGLVYVTNEWIDVWGQPGSIKVEARKTLPAKPKIRNIRLPDQGAPNYAPYKPLYKEKVKDEHRTRPKPTVLGKIWSQSKPKKKVIQRLGKGDDLDLTWEEEYDVWLADCSGAGLDEYDTHDDDECYYVLDIGECDAQTCAIVTIDEETAEGEEGPSQVQDAGKTAGAEASDLDQDDYYRFG